ncbi:MAG: hypothetical protein RSB39_07000, partial [Oscillospiraceae bacterium]
SDKNSFARQKDDWTEDDGRLRPEGAELDGGRGTDCAPGAWSWTEDGGRIAPEGAEMDEGMGWGVEELVFRRLLKFVAMCIIIFRPHMGKRGIL